VNASSKAGILLFFVALAASRVAFAGGDIWIKTWAEANEKNGSNTKIGLYVGVYFALGMGASALGVFGNLILRRVCTIKVAFS
jgi:ATP-binding cassette, subfamily C (CFTR/MRP), member 1